MTTSVSCDLKWNEKVFYLTQSSASSCCRAYPMDLDQFQSIEQVINFWQEEQQLLQRGVKVQSCEVCWKIEEQGLTSARLSNLTDNVNRITLNLSNACNQMCSYCSPKYSSTWQNNIIQHGMFEQISKSAQHNLEIPDTHKLNQSFWIDQINTYISDQADQSVVLTLVGGEPLMQVSSLQRLIELNNSKIKKIVITTNLNPPDNKFLLWLITKFSNERLFFAISIDADPDYNHIPRSKFLKEEFLQNLKILIDHNYQFHFLTVVSVLNFFNLPNYLKWINQNNFQVVYNKLNNPDCLDPAYVPDQFASLIFDQLQQYDLTEIITEIKNPKSLVDLKLKEQYNYLTQYFERTSIDVNTANKEFKQYWDWLEGKYK